MRYQRSLAVLALATMMFETACGGSPTSSPGGGDNSAATSAAQGVYDRFNGMSGQARTDELVKAAKAEGGLSIYTSNNDIADLVDAFKAKYGLDVKTYRASSEAVLQRILQEEKANYRGADIVETNSGEMNVLSSDGYLYPYKSEYREKVRPQGLKDNWTADRFNAFVVGWNTNRVPAGEEPTSLEDLADPRWKGKLAMEIAEVDWFASLTKYWLEHGKTQEEVDRLFDAIAANAKITKGHTATGELLAAGQYGVFVSAYTQNIDGQAAKGAPVSWRPANGTPVQPITLRPNGFGLMKDAAHPASALLFADFLLTEGQDALEELHRIPSVLRENDPLAGLDLIEAPEEDLLTNSAEWSARYQKVTQQAGQH
jgi:iron(III) transport system substrate-binding protein